MTHAKKRWGKAAIGIAASAAMLLATPLSALACTQIYVGNQFTADGATYLGRNEDAEPRAVKVFGVQESRTGTIEYSSAMSDFTWSKTGTTYRHTYVRDAKDTWKGRTDAYAEDGTNSAGLTVDATESLLQNSKVDAADPIGMDENADELRGGGASTGIGEYNVTDILLDWCKTPEEAVKLLGSIIDQYGAYDANELTLTDKQESWSFWMLSGHQWVAFKMPEDKASVLPNMESEEFKVNLDDPSQCIHSAGLVSMPKEAGFLITFADGMPNIAATYGIEDEGSGQYDRYVQGRAYFDDPVPSDQMTIDSRGGVSMVNHPQFFFTPGKSDYSTMYILRSLGYRGQGTAFNANTNKHIWPIGNTWTYEGHFFQVHRNWDANIGTLEWLGLSHAPYTVYLPNYTMLLTKVDPLYGDINTTDGTGHDEPDANGPDANGDDIAQALEPEPENNFDFVLMDLNTLCIAYQSACANISKYEDVMQQDIIDQQQAVDAAMKGQSDDVRAQWANKLSATAVQSAYTKMKPVLDGLKAQIKSGDTTTAYMPSDYDAAKNTMKTPFAYADAVISPAFTKSPKPAVYKQGAKAEALSAEAVENDNDPLFTNDQKLTYTWYAKKSAAATGAKAALFAAAAADPDGYVKVGEGKSFTPSTETVGTTEYLVRATNYAGLSTDATDAVAVTAASATSATPTKPSTGASATKPAAGSSAKSSAKASAAGASSLATTGSSVEGILVIALVATAGGAAAIAAKKRMHA